MKKVARLTLAELKNQSLVNNNVIANIEAIKGGADEEYCHEGNGKPSPEEVQEMMSVPSHTLKEVHQIFDDFIRDRGIR